jgi:hypothetical protein
MLYGSVARGDAVSRSDVDLLAVDDRPRAPRDVGRISLTVYSEHHLRELSRRGSLFVLHLRTEGHILRDDDGVFERIFHDWRDPDVRQLFQGIRAASAVLDVSPEVRARHGCSLLRVALFVLRSVLYLRCIELGEPVFAMHRVAVVLKDARILSLFETTRTRDDTDVQLQMALELLDHHLGGRMRNPFGTLEALAVSWYTHFPMASDLAVTVLVGAPHIDYARAPANWVAP